MASPSPMIPPHWPWTAPCNPFPISFTFIFHSHSDQFHISFTSVSHPFHIHPVDSWQSASEPSLRLALRQVHLDGHLAGGNRVGGKAPASIRLAPVRCQSPPSHSRSGYPIIPLLLSFLLPPFPPPFAPPFAPPFTPPLSGD